MQLLLLIWKSSISNSLCVFIHVYHLEICFFKKTFNQHTENSPVLFTVAEASGLHQHVNRDAQETEDTEGPGAWGHHLA